MLLNPKLKILVVEDESLLAEDIKLRLTKMGYEVAAIAHSADQALEALEQNPLIDLAILDIILKGKIDGIELADMINNDYHIPFIFLTSHADKALVDRAKAVKPYAYMLKPFNDREIAITMEIALANYSNHAPQQELISGNGEFTTDDNQIFHINEKLFLKKENHFQKVNLKDIIFLEADNNYTSIHTLDERFIYSIVLKKMIEKLPPQQFIRVHRGYVVNIDAVNGFEGNTLFVGNKKVPVSKPYRDSVFKIFNIL
ncbi:response regulator [Fulvivirga maritima]|uniref:LytR/AlgR family response regulator transcription factor n=1 Tax=Fulvivirga maritima TaxID=2904247 RepID=UPI001F3A5425|nr:LytTR family transcriptional regulator DNA-binding domain-containing protein [Fulvivirga maritima]UII26534.1 response regulator [Fulvivirga maritima]